MHNPYKNDTLKTTITSYFCIKPLLFEWSSSTTSKKHEEHKKH